MSTKDKTIIGSTGMAALLNQAKKTGEEVKNIKSADSVTKQPPVNEETNITAKEETNSTVSSPKESHSEKKGIENIFEPTGKLDGTDVIRIPSDLHRKYKVLAGISNVPLSNIVTNILFDFYASNEKAIKTYIRKNTTL
jgi:hypothetical protein